jgi:3-oxoacyl-(acyl-carrier-protein) synthase
MKAYITSTAAISPQSTLDEKNYLENLKFPEKEFLEALEPEYREFIDPKLSRRMARIIKMGVTTAKVCLDRAGIKMPGAIIVGTGLGCLQDTEKFLVDLLENKEGLLSPTSFIQSTHNTIAGQIALTLNCTNHNFTFTQRGHSFENSLEDALLQLNEGVDNVLVGGIDEVTPTLYKILSQAGFVKNTIEQDSANSNSNQPAFLGEGAAFFTLSDKQSETTLATIDAFRSFYAPVSENAIAEQVKSFLKACNVDLNEIDTVMMGYNGSESDDAIYERLREQLFEDKQILSFKNLCGEYFTASAFGHHLAANVVYRQKVIPEIQVTGKSPETINKLLFYNHTNSKYHTLTLFSKCQPL